MKNTLSIFDRLMTAITFAEANEPEIARGYLAHKAGVKEHIKRANRNVTGTHGAGRRTVKAGSH